MRDTSGALADPRWPVLVLLGFVVVAGWLPPLFGREDLFYVVPYFGGFVGACIALGHGDWPVAVACLSVSLATAIVVGYLTIRWRHARVPPGVGRHVR